MAERFDPYWKWLGIPPAEQPPHYYRLLGISLFEADPEVISNAADRQMAHVRHYQAGKSAAHSQRILNELSTARLHLLSPERKAEYDAQLQLALQSRQPPPAPAGFVPAADEGFSPETWEGPGNDRWLEPSQPWAEQPDGMRSEGIELPFSTEPTLPFSMEPGGEDVFAAGVAPAAGPFEGVSPSPPLPSPVQVPGMGAMPGYAVQPGIGPIVPIVPVLPGPPVPPAPPGVASPMMYSPQPGVAGMAPATMPRGGFTAAPGGEVATVPDGIALPFSTEPAAQYDAIAATLPASPAEMAGPGAYSVEDSVGVSPLRSASSNRALRRQTMRVSGGVFGAAVLGVIVVVGLVVWALSQPAPQFEKAPRGKTPPRKPKAAASGDANKFTPPTAFPKQSFSPAPAKASDGGGTGFPEGASAFPSLSEPATSPAKPSESAKPAMDDGAKPAMEPPAKPEEDGAKPAMEAPKPAMESPAEPE